MLDMLRKNSQSFLIYLIFGAIIVVFAVNFGPGGGTCGGAGNDYAARVNGEVIRRQEFSVQFNQMVEYRRRTSAMTGGNFNLETAERSGMRRRVVDEMIKDKLLAQEARARGMRVSDAELLEFLEKRFRVDEVSFEDYESWVTRNFEQSVTRFESERRNDILAERMERIVRDNVAVSDEELKRTYEREHDRAMVTFVKFDTSGLDRDAKAVKPSAAEIDDLLAKDMAAVEERYKRDMFKYRTPQQVQVRQILKKLPADASDADVAKLKGQLGELKDQIKGGADFAALAKQHSDDEATKANGGDLGWVKRGQMAKALVDAVIDLKKDAIATEIVRTPQGLHLLQVTDVKPPERQELEAVKRDVAASIVADRAQDLAAKAQADELLAKLQAGKKLEELTISAEDEKAAEEDPAKKAKLADKPVRSETPWILKSQEALPRMGVSKELQEEIFALSKEKPLAKQPYKVGRSWFVVILKDRETPDLAKFDGEKENLKREMLQVRGAEIYEAWLENLKKSARIDLNPELFPPEEENGMPMPMTLPMQPS
jgi:peptidyl-prolyl cis-trans isomerase D